ncbi:hypothetical protein Ssi03_65960 [Sphaerisporangium siamense]|nr:hypothetical protein Ssi03_65960 [Sphaerisporangium siamense]
MIALTATALLAPALALAASATAHAAPKPTAAGPADALRQQLVKRTTVRIDERNEFRLGKTALRYRETGVVRFGRSGPDAGDTKLTISSGASKSTGHIIALGGKVYVKSPVYDDALPAGKTWVRFTGPARTTLLVDVLRPRTLGALVAHTKSKAPGGTVNGARTTLLRGAITLGELAKVSPDGGLRGLSGKEKKIAVPWKLWVGGDQLPRRFQAAVVLPGPAPLGDLKLSSDARYAGWGGHVAIQAPPADLVVDQKDLETDEDLPEARPDLITTITGRAAAKS